MPLRVLTSASHEPGRLNSTYAELLETMGVEVAKHFEVGESQIVKFAFADRLIHRLAPKIAWNISNRQLTKTTKIFRPHVVWLFKAMDIFPQTLRSLKELGAKLICYNADHPFDFFSRGSGNRNVSSSVPEYDLYITYSRHIEGLINKRHPELPTMVVPFGHVLDEARFERACGADEANRACFVGNADSHRVEMLKRIARSGVPLDVYGHNWDSHRAALGDVALCGPVTGDDYYRTLRRYRVQLNFFRPHNIHSHNMRTFEVPASGGIMLAPDSVEHREFFEEGKEAFYFSNGEQMVEQAKRVLALPPAEAARIRERARLRSVESGYSYRDRAETILDAMRSLT